MIFDMDTETLPREELEALQLKRLQSLCERVYANVAFYRRETMAWICGAFGFEALPSGNPRVFLFRKTPAETRGSSARHKPGRRDG